MEKVMESHGILKSSKSRQTDRQTDRHVCLFGVLYNKYIST